MLYFQTIFYKRMKMTVVQNIPFDSHVNKFGLLIICFSRYSLKDLELLNLFETYQL